MTYRISKTALDRCRLGDFAARSAAHAVAMKEWRAHMGRVADDEKNGVTGIEKHMPHPRPLEHELVEAAVNENDEMDYELVDDGPTPEQILRAQKDNLLGMVSVAEREAIVAVVAPGRQRLFNLRENDIRASDAVRLQEIAARKSQRWNEWSDGQGKKSALKKIGEVLRIVQPEPFPDDIDVHVETAKTRDPEDAMHLEEQNTRREKMEAIARAAAQVQHDIEDLTAETIGDWKVPDFKGI